MLGLALDAGGVKGAAHIGVLEALEEEGIKVDLISGSSSGSIVATMYAIGYSPIQILSMYKTYCHLITDYDRKIPFKILSMIFTGKLKLKGLVKGKVLENIIYEMCNSKNMLDISNVKMPLAVPSVDINKGETVYFTNRYLNENERGENLNECNYLYKGFLPSIIRASCSIPAVFEPKMYYNRFLVDGGVKVSCPVKILKNMGAKKVIAVCFENNKKISNSNNNNVIEIALSSFEIMSEKLKKEELKFADYKLNIEISNVSTFDCNKVSYMANLGYIITKKNIDKIKELINSD